MINSIDEEEYRIDIAKMIINNFNENEENELKLRLKLYLQTHKSTCNDYLYTHPKHKNYTYAFTSLYQKLSNDLCAEIARNLNE